MTGVLAVVPAYNEEESLPSVLAELTSLELTDGRALRVAVVDDGSSDRTAEVASAAGAEVLRLPFNLGVGGAVRTGLRFALAEDADRVVVLDADGQHGADDIEALLAALDGGASMAIGSRFADPDSDYGMSRTRRAAQRLLNRVVRSATGFEATDATSGFRAFDRDVVAFLADNYPVEYLADTVEVIVLVRRAGYDVVEVPVTMQARHGGQPSKTSFGLVFNYLRLLVGVAGTAVAPRPSPDGGRPA